MADTRNPSISDESQDFEFAVRVTAPSFQTALDYVLELQKGRLPAIVGIGRSAERDVLEEALRNINLATNNALAITEDGAPDGV